MKIEMPKSSGIVLATKGKFCKEDIEVVPTFDINEKIFVDYIQGTIYEVTAEDLKGVTYISPYAFYYRPITSIELSDSIVSIGEQAFTYSNLKSVKLSEGMTSIGANAFYRCYDLESVDLGKSITRLESYVFCQCTSLTSIDISNITSTGNGPFDGSGLTHLTVPGTLNTLSNYFAQNCKSLTAVRLENGVVKLNQGAFSNCTNLMEIVCLSTNPPSIYHNSFNGVPEDCVIKVPAASVEAYKTATNWSERADYIIAYEENQA